MMVMFILCMVVFMLLVSAVSVIPQPSRMSLFELRRRAEKKDRVAEALLERETLLQDVLSIQRVFVALLLVLFVTLTVYSFGWLLGIFISIVAALEYGAIARLPWLHRRTQQFYERIEPKLLMNIKKYAGIFRFVRSAFPETKPLLHVDSREELEHVIQDTGTILSSDEKKLLLHGLAFKNSPVRDVMTPSGTIDSIGKNELLGPLVLDDLHKTGHSRFPVVDGDIDHVVGMLYIRNIFALDTKKSLTAEKAMEPRVFYINENQPLSQALAAFIRTRHHLFVVVNEFRETVGLVSLEDVVEALIGRKIIDEFDTHEDLRIVAARNIRANNLPSGREDV